MKRIILIYGVLVGAIVICTMIIGYALATPDMNTASYAFGYLTMLVAMSLIFAGIKKYRDRDLGGVIRFWPGLRLGLGISAVAGIIYVIGWEINLALTDYVFIENYTKGIIEAKKSEGLSGEALETVIANMEKMKTNYGNPFYRMPMTFIEIFPVGFLVSLLSAAILRNPKVLPTRK